MKKYVVFSGLLALSMIFSSCKSTITAAKVIKQEEAANKAVEEAEEAIVKLAEMKEQYSVDGIQAQVDLLKQGQKKIKKDISHLEKVSSDSGQDATKSAVKSLEKESAELSKKISELEAMPKENWQENILNIKETMENLKKQIAMVTQNLDRSAE